MKKVILSIVIIAAVVFTSCKNEAKKEVEKTVEATSASVVTKEVTFGVRGNCGMCKETIEKAVKGLEGIAVANWDKVKKEIKVSFEESKTDLDAIHNAIAASGYDTDKVAGNEQAYEDLPMCCKYDHEMEMSLTGDVKVDETSNH